MRCESLGYIFAIGHRWTYLEQVCTGCNTVHIIIFLLKKLCKAKGQGWSTDGLNFKDHEIQKCLPMRPIKIYYYTIYIFSKFMSKK